MYSDNETLSSDECNDIEIARSQIKIILLTSVYLLVQCSFMITAVVYD